MSQMRSTLTLKCSWLTLLRGQAIDAQSVKTFRAERGSSDDGLCRPRRRRMLFSTPWVACKGAPSAHGCGVRTDGGHGLATHKRCRRRPRNGWIDCPTRIGKQCLTNDTTVETHVTRLLLKLSLRDRAQAIVLALPTGR